METNKLINNKRGFFSQTAFVWLSFFVTVMFGIAATNIIQMKSLDSEAKNMLYATQSTINAVIDKSHHMLDTAGKVVIEMYNGGESTERILKYLKTNGINGDFGDTDFPGNEEYEMGDTSHSKPYVSDTESGYAVTLTKKVMNGGSVLCVISTDVDVSEFSENVLDISSTDGGFGMLADSDMTFFIHPNADFLGEKMPEANDFFTGVDKALEDTNIYTKNLTNYKGEWSVIYILKMDNGWYLGFLTPYFKYYSQVFRLAAALAVIGILAAVALTFILARLNKKDEYNMRILGALNQSATMLLANENERKFLSSVTRSLEIIGKIADMDRIVLFLKSEDEGEKCVVSTFMWVSDYCRKNCAQIPDGWKMNYDAAGELRDKFRDDVYVNDIISRLPYVKYPFLHEFDVRSVIFLPLFAHGEFQGLITADNCRKEKPFPKNDVHMLRSAGLMLISAMEHYRMLEILRESSEKFKVKSHWYEQLLDSIPHPFCTQDTDMRWTFMNKRYEEMFGRNRENDLGTECSACKSPLCGTEDCVIKAAQRGQFRTIAQNDGMSHQIDTRIIRDLDGKEIGYIELIQDITEMSSLLTKKLEAESANKAKSKFLAAISHEIRTPMNAIIGIADINLRKKTLTPDIRNALEIIHNSGHILLGIINEILDLSKIEAGKMVINPDKYDSAKLIGDIVQLNVAHIGSKPIEFDLYIDPSVPSELFGDSVRIGQILNNILSNAVKYTKHGRVSLSVEADMFESKDAVTLILKVSDTGSGMTREQIAMLFDEYARFNTGANRLVEGVGLGMSITKKLIDLMGGVINVKSEREFGTMVTVKLPQGKIGSGEIGIELSENMRKLNFLRTKLKNVQIAYAPMSGKTVLVVDDNETNLIVTEGLLAPYKLKAEYTSSGVAAVEKIKSGKVYDLILMDHMMPVMDGMEATGIIRSLGYEKPIVALTADAMAGNREMFIAKGFDDYITKPVDTRHLDNVLKKLIPSDKSEIDESLGAGAVFERVDIDLAGALIRDIRKAVKALEAALSSEFNGDFKEYVTAFHGVKGVLVNSGYSSLSEEALRLEVLARAEESAALREQTPEFIKQLTALMDSVAGAIGV